MFNIGIFKAVKEKPPFKKRMKYYRFGHIRIYKYFVWKPMKTQDIFLCGRHFNIGILDNKIPMEDNARFIHFNRKPKIVIFK